WLTGSKEEVAKLDRLARLPSIGRSGSSRGFGPAGSGIAHSFGGVRPWRCRHDGKIPAKRLYSERSTAGTDSKSSPYRVCIRTTNWSSDKVIVVFDPGNNSRSKRSMRVLRLTSNLLDELGSFSDEAPEFVQ